MEVTSRQEAMRLGLKRYYTGKPCKRGHLSERLVSTFSCIECQKILVRDWKGKNPERDYETRKASWTRHYWRHAEELRVKNKKYRSANMETLSERNRAYRERIKADPVARERRLAYMRDYKKKHPEKRAATQAMRRAAKANATPRWLTKKQKDQIREMYKRARHLTQTTLFEWHVDHVMPLKGKNFCGLHVPWNLQLLPSDINIKKHNHVS